MTPFFQLNGQQKTWPRCVSIVSQSARDVAQSLDRYYNQHGLSICKGLRDDFKLDRACRDLRSSLSRFSKTTRLRDTRELKLKS